MNMKSHEVQLYMRHIMDYITEVDYEAAIAIVPIPEEFDFHKIL